MIATPACFKVSPTNKSMLLSLNVGSESSTFDKHWTITNISSIPIPSNKNGIRGWAGVKTKPIVEQIPKYVVIVLLF